MFYVLWISFVTSSIGYQLHLSLKHFQ